MEYIKNINLLFSDQKITAMTNFIGKASEPPGSGSPVGGGLITITAGEFKCFTATCCCLVLCMGSKFVVQKLIPQIDRS